MGSIAFYLAMNLYEGESYRLVHYLSIVYCFVFVLVSVLIKKKNYFFILAMLFTAIADFFLVLPEAPNQTPGMLFFFTLQVYVFPAPVFGATCKVIPAVACFPPITRS